VAVTATLEPVLNNSSAKVSIKLVLPPAPTNAIVSPGLISSWQKSLFFLSEIAFIIFCLVLITYSFLLLLPQKKIKVKPEKTKKENINMEGDLPS
jgi:hypothetical protein